MTRRTFADVRREERTLEREGFLELIEQKKTGLRHAIGQGRISAELANAVENILTSLADDVNAGLHRMDLNGPAAAEALADKRRK